MTVAALPNVITFAGSGSAGPFSFAFVFFEDSQISATITDPSGNVTNLVQNVDYTVSGAGSNSGGSVQLVNALNSGYTLTVTRTLQLEQSTSFQDQGPFFASTIEQALDYITMLCQQLQYTGIEQSVPGPQGAQGPQGFQGVQGGAGYQGPQGSTGNQGPQGDEGPQGPQGYQGQPGGHGPQGDDGNQGPQGANGNQGYQGNQGVQGPQGNPGSGLNFRGAWQSGAQYAIGDAAVDQNVWYACYVGVQGSTEPVNDPTHWASLGQIGAQGYQGHQGAQGAQGPQGYAGSQGPPGPQGNAGSQGPQGVQGVAGPQGFTGSQGARGPQGYQGSQGSQGPPGNQGTQGPQGSGGSQGPQGSQGSQGSMGPSLRDITRNLAINSDGLHTITITADGIIVQDPSNVSQALRNVNTTIVSTNSGAGGLDTGSMASSTWYYIWAIAKADGTTAAMLSLSSTAPTMPTGYTYKSLIGTALNQPSANLMYFKQRGNLVICAQYAVSIVNTGSIATHNVPLGISPLAVKIVGYVNGACSNVSTWSLNLWPYNDGSGIGNIGIMTQGTQGAVSTMTVPFILPLIVAQTFYSTVTPPATTGTVSITGWEYV